MKKPPKNYCIWGLLVLCLTVRSYLMSHHRITKISRVDARTNFTEGFVPDHYYSFITVKVQAQNVKTSLFHVVIVHQISNKIFLFALCQLLRSVLYGWHVVWVEGLSDASAPQRLSCNCEAGVATRGNRQSNSVMSS